MSLAKRAGTAITCLLLPFCAAGQNQIPRSLQDAAERIRAIRTLSATIEMTYGPSSELKRSSGSLKLMRPNLALVQLHGDYPIQVLASDGTSVFILASQNTYKKLPASASGDNIDTPWFGLPFRYFFTQSGNPFGSELDASAEVRLVGEETVRGQHTSVIQAKGEKPMPYVAMYFFSGQGVMLRSVVNFGAGTNNAVSFTADLFNVKIDEKLTLSDFIYAPPASAALDLGYEEKLLAINSDAPDLTLPALDGSNLSLSEQWRHNKATLLNFWFLNCPPCRIEFPEFQRLYDDLGAKGLSIVAINRGDRAEDVSRYLEKEGLSFSVVLGGDEGSPVFRSFKVETFPVTYLVDGNGRVVYRSAGMDIRGLRAALGSLGIQ